MIGLSSGEDDKSSGLSDNNLPGDGGYKTKDARGG